VTPYRFDHFEIRPTERQLLVAGHSAPLGARAFDLLLVLVERRDRTVTKNELLDLVWPGLVVEENNLQVQISTLRKVLGQDAIATIPGQGYRFTLRAEGAVASSSPRIAAADNTQSHPVVEAAVHSIAILPFAAPGGGAAEAQLADGLTRDLTVAFGRIRWARVTSYALTSTYKGKAIDARTVGRELNVRYLVEGEVRLAGEVFITDIRLVDTGTASQVWSNRFKLERGSAEQNPGALVTPLTQNLRVSLHSAERHRIGTESAIDATAIELWLRANNVWEMETDPLKGALAARKLYDEALRLDPRLVSALLSRGDTLITELELNRDAARDRLVQELDDLSMRAVGLDPDDSNVWWLRSRALAFQWRWDAALEANSKQQSLDPTRAYTIYWRAWMMNMMGKPAEALPLVDRALALDPLDVWFALRMRCRAYLVLGRYKDAIDACEKAETYDDSWLVYAYLLAAYAHEGEVAKAETAKAALLRRRPGLSIADIKALKTSNEPAYLQQVETHFYSGLRKAGIPEQ